MAKVKGLKALFTGSQIRKVLDKKAKEYEDKMVQTLQFIGERFVNDARVNGNYTDRTGNLRSSIGYIILKDGIVLKNNFRGKAIGVAKARDFALSVARIYGTGFVLIGVAGMEYAAAVEAKGFDVITSSAPTGGLLRKILNGIEL